MPIHITPITPKSRFRESLNCSPAACRKGAVFDPFAGSDMTGVAAQVLGFGRILYELSPAASLVARQFNATFDPAQLTKAIDTVLGSTLHLRHRLCTTVDRLTGAAAEFEYVVCSYRVRCSGCHHKFTLWDHGHRCGRGVREHKTLSTFPCPNCTRAIEKDASNESQSFRPP